MRFGYLPRREDYFPVTVRGTARKDGQRDQGVNIKQWCDDHQINPGDNATRAMIRATGGLA